MTFEEKRKEKKKKKVWLVIGIGNPLVDAIERKSKRNGILRVGTLNDVVKTSSRDFLENS